MEALRQARVKAVAVSKKHGMCGTPTYESWVSMMARCTNPNRPGFQRYGGRGIRVCERWIDFRNFLEDMNVRPANTELDRINNDGNYEPGNCRWATRVEQCNNTGAAHLLTWNGVTHSIADWARLLNVPYARIQSRVKRGWPIDRIFRDLQ